MKQTINKYQFNNAFSEMNRNSNFSYEARQSLFEYFEQLEEDTGVEIELDIIAICCEYAEDDYKSIANNYSIEPSDIEEGITKQDVIDYLFDNSNVICDHNDLITYQQF